MLDDIDDNEKEITKIWAKMLTTTGHGKECEIMNLKIDRAIRESGDAIQAKMEATMIDFQTEMKGLLDNVVKAVQANGTSPKKDEVQEL